MSISQLISGEGIPTCRIHLQPEQVLTTYVNHLQSNGCTTVYVRFNSVAAGTVYSPTAAANYPDPTVFDEVRKRQPSGTLAEPEEISAAVSFLLSPAAAYITGTLHSINFYIKFTENVFEPKEYPNEHGHFRNLGIFIKSAIPKIFKLLRLMDSQF